MTVASLLRLLKEEFPDGPEDLKDQVEKLNAARFRLVLRGLGFRWGRVTGRTFIYVRNQLILARLRYLRIEKTYGTFTVTIKNYSRILQLRDQAALIFFINETWTFEGMGHQFNWIDLHTKKTPKRASSVV